MKDKWIFEIPNEVEVMVKLVQAVPSSWLSISGVLEAPNVLVEVGDAIHDTGYNIDQFYTIKPTIVKASTTNRRKNDSRQNPDLYALIAERKMPGFVRFEEAGADSYEISFGTARKILISFLRQGYRGQVTFCGQRCNEGIGELPGSGRECEKCFFFFEWHYKNPPKVEIWNDGRPENFQPLITACRAMGLKELTPQLAK